MKMEDIEKLEKKYFGIVDGIFSKPQTINFIKKSMKNINKHLKVIQGEKKNQVEDSLEQMVRMILFTHAASKKGWNPALFPVGSDVTFQTNDCFLFCDVKTIAAKAGKPDTDAKNYRIQVQGNESTYPDNDTPYTVTARTHKDQKVKWQGPNIPTTIERKPVITLFISFHYEETSQKYKIKESVLYCIPNGNLKSKYGNLIHDFKGIVWFKEKTIHLEVGKGTNARFSSDLFKTPKLTHGWFRKKILSKITNI